MILKSKVTPCLLFGGNAQDAAKFYTKIFKNSKILQSSPVATTFRIEGHDFVALNGPKSEFTWAVSFYVLCKDQKEVDLYWKKLSSGGGEEQQCGWVKDKFGLSWQIVPKGFVEMVEGKDKKKSERAMQAMMQMKKLDLAKLKKAYDGK